MNDQTTALTERRVKKDEPMTVKVGDLVLYGKYAGTEIKVDGQEYLIMREDEVLAVIEDGGDTKKKK